MKPRKLISSRYSISQFNNKYQTISVTGSDNPKLGTKLDSGQGYIFAPYIMVENTAIVIDGFESRIDKLKRLINKKDA